MPLAARCSVYLLYWYKSTKLTRRMALVELNATIDVVCRGKELETLGSFVVNPKFTYFTSTKVQILTLTRLPGLHAAKGCSRAGADRGGLVQKYKY